MVVGAETREIKAGETQASFFSHSILHCASKAVQLLTAPILATLYLFPSLVPSGIDIHSLVCCQDSSEPSVLNTSYSKIHMFSSFSPHSD